MTVDWYLVVWQCSINYKA